MQLKTAIKLCVLMAILVALQIALSLLDVGLWSLIPAVPGLVIGVYVFYHVARMDTIPRTRR